MDGNDRRIETEHAVLDRMGINERILESAKQSQERYGLQ